MTDTRFAPPFEGQQFTSHQQWVNKASSWLTCHPEYRNTEHGEAKKGWRGAHFTAMCFDSLGRRGAWRPISGGSAGKGLCSAHAANARITRRRKAPQIDMEDFIDAQRL
ncbi:hypothetical protein AWJ26_gp05 (endogenous virus) [Sinorhizobium phage phiLM21]|uniref:hypothetical protein n=1 Tax=Sinorhizobium phage phiLM21 TaxID=1524882 RepID=UPI0004E5DC5C|nr:hypothetical protein AWJ26_gp05 [Sinorhizobium phage phiLM21]AII27757.1 hypothetical protein phiLM21_p005 [Sinorhizobium phage phiLM21]